MIKILLLAVGLLTAGSTLAANLVTNGGFENTAGFVDNGQNTMSLGAGSTTMTGWTVINDTIAWIGDPNPFGPSANEGVRFLDLTDYSTGAPFGGVRQTIVTQIGAVYDISFDVGAFGGTSRVQFTAGSFIAPLASASSTSGSSWTTFNSSFTATGLTTTIDLLGMAASANGNYIGLDNVVVTLNHVANPVPEPETYAMMLAGLGLLGFVARRRKQKAVV